MSTDEQGPVRVGVLSLHNSKETKAILNAVEDLGHEPVWLRRENTTVSIEDSEVTVDPDQKVHACGGQAPKTTPADCRTGG